ncbi:Eco57I restriction-modification methylase domain-containing protein [Enterococcus cecorum]|uniref:Eco57I restriction-modification methylase domain-containing protein n=3 Tax=Enterococcus cecorum TaxID=44008 RepID=UPI00148C6DAB|nr:Eco57I restriction-modification methylase domain-containing protein [Enterococcus cecorum]MCJ0576368.1 Eco57I restriction-modification methylase domain-containing protein [Enterococcus cecorum]
MEDKFQFDVIIGNPPYQEEAKGDSTQTPPIYHLFMEEAYNISPIVSFITPARFLFNAGATPKKWNQKMLNDPHFKIIDYIQDSSVVFPTTDIKGGVAISYRDENKEYIPIDVFTSYSELNGILHKVTPQLDHTMNEIITGRGVYKLSDKALEDYPEIINIQSKGHSKDVGSSAFKILENIVFFKEKQNEDDVAVIGRINNQREIWWIKREYLSTPESFDYYKVILPKANGSGAIGEVLSTPLIGEPLIGEPLIGHTETFISIGKFISLNHAENLMKYIKSKFARAMLGVLKITQDNTRDKWAKVPMQDFTDSSDIDWSKSISEIDQQLYRKYGLSDEEIQFIEEKVRSMEEED